MKGNCNGKCVLFSEGGTELGERAYARRKLRCCLDCFGT